MTPARLIIDGAARGAWNMAVDQALFESVGRRDRPTLRLYQWSPATLSLGYFQPLADRHQHAASRNCDLVRRATGGGAIVHDVEWTYSLVLPAPNRWSARHQQVVVQVHQALIDALAQQGVAARFYSPPSTQDASRDREPIATGDRERALAVGNAAPAGQLPFLCFERRSAEDVVVRQWKIAGSAQRRVEGALLQHGSVLVGKSTWAPELPGLSDLAILDIAPLVTRWTANIASRLQLTWHPGSLEDAEYRLAEEVERNRFGHDRWTAKR